MPVDPIITGDPVVGRPQFDVIVRNLGALMMIWEASSDLGWVPEALFAQGLLIQLAELINSNAYPGTEARAVANIVLGRFDPDSVIEQIKGGPHNAH